MKHFSNINPEDDAVNIISWHLLTLCQYKCPYCYARKEMPWGKIASKAEIDQMLSMLAQTPTEFHLELAGGEPTLHPLITYIVDRMQIIKKCTALLLYTNLDKFLLFRGKVKYRISWHPGVSKPVVLENIKRLHDAGMKPDIIVMMPPNNPVPSTVLAKLREYGNVEYNYVSVGDKIKANVSYSYEDMQDGYMLDGKFVSSIEANNTSFKGWSCRASRIDIDVLGNIYEACRPVGANAYRSSWLASWRPRTIICKNDRCPACLLQLPKYLGISSSQS